MPGRRLAWLLLAACMTAAGEASIGERLAASSPERGEALFRACRACHGIDEGAAQTLGPNLRGVVGRPVASVEGYDGYSPAMESSGGSWTAERLDRYLRRPAEEIEGTSMIFPGIPDAAARADIIAWLGATSGTLPAPAGDGTEAAASERTAPAIEDAQLGLLVSADGAQATQAYCTVCHSDRIIVQQGLVREDWLEVIEYMVDEHGMAPLEASDLDRVIDYLSAHYGPDRPNFSFAQE